VVFGLLSGSYNSTQIFTEYLC